MPSATFVVVEADRLADSSPATAGIRAKVSAKKTELDKQLVPYAASLSGAPREAPKTDAEKKARDEQDKKAIALRDKLTKQLEAFQKAQLAPLLDALSKSLAPKAKQTKLDYVIAIGAVPTAMNSGGVNSELDDMGPFSESSIFKCRLVRADLEVVLRDTKRGQTFQETAKKKVAELEKQGQAKNQVALQMAQQDLLTRIGVELGNHIKTATKVTERVCLVDHKVLKSGAAGIYERTKGSLAKLPDSTAWLVANLDKWVSAEQQELVDASLKQMAQSDLVDEWVKAMGPTLAGWRGAAVTPPPRGFASAWKSTKPFGAYADAVVGLDANKKARARIVLGTELSLAEAEAIRDKVREDINNWSTSLPWIGADLPEEALATGYQQARVWGKPKDGSPVGTDIWNSLEAYKLRGPGSIFLTIEPSTTKTKSTVILELAEAAVPPPVKPGILPE